MAKRILIADDEEDIKDVMQMYLESEGYEVETAYDGLDAIDRIQTWKPDLVLLDIMMPVMDGITVCKTVRADPESALIPIIMVSAASKQEKEADAMLAGATGYLLKPFENTDLVQIVKKCLGETQ